jgi:acetyl-CoA acyltransferase
MGMKKGRMIGIRSDDLAVQVVKALLQRNPGLPPDSVEDLVLGCAFPEHTQGMLVARGVALLAGLATESGGKVVNRFCGSSMDSAHQLSQAIIAGDLQCGIAVGVEDMFSIPVGGYNPSFNRKLVEIDYYIGMGETAEKLAQELSITREEQEEFSVSSHRKALDAWKGGMFADEVVPVQNGADVIDKDEGPREPDVEKMRTLKPAFMAKGTITAATSSPISIGAAAMIVCSEEFAKQHKLRVRARIVSRAIAGVDWTRIHGGAIARGHPLGASGARIMATLINVLEKRKGKTGLATMCIGTGQGIATVIERV